MIEPDIFNPLGLPSVSLEQKTRLPEIAAVYFAIDPEDKIQYIGMALNLRERWVGHHQFNRLRVIGGVKIAYLEIQDRDAISKFEKAFISLFKPPLNGEYYDSSKPLTNNGMGLKVRRIVKQEVDVPGLGDQIKKAREASDRAVTELAKASGISRNYWYQLEAEAVLGGVAEETLRKIEEVLGIDFGVKLDV